MNISKIKKQYSKVERNLYGMNSIEHSLAILYNENSKLNSYELRKFEDKIRHFSASKACIKSTKPYKCYPGNEIINLSQFCINAINNNNLIECLLNRRSNRSYNNYQLTLNEIATLLYNSYGVTTRHKAKAFGTNIHVGLKNVPSGGALYPLEVYIVIFNSELDQGLYHYRPDLNILEVLRKGDFINELSTIIKAEPFVEMQKASVLIITTSILERMLLKYGDRGYRFILLESGFVAQLISLLATSIGLGSCMLGAFLDDEINCFLDIDGTFETVNNIIILGK